MKIYLADKFGHKMKMRDVRDKLVAKGHDVTAQWIDVEHEDDKDKVVTDEMREEYAVMDVADVLRSDVLIAFSSPRSLPSVGGGRHVEFGLAICAGIPIIVVGPKGEHIFHYMRGVMHVDEFDGVFCLLGFPKLLEKLPPLGVPR